MNCRSPNRRRLASGVSDLPASLAISAAMRRPPGVFINSRQVGDRSAVDRSGSGIITERFLIETVPGQLFLVVVRHDVLVTTNRLIDQSNQALLILVQVTAHSSAPPMLLGWLRNAYST